MEKNNNQISNGVNKKFITLVVFGVALATFALVLQWGNFGTAMLWRLSNEGSWLLPLIGTAAVLDSINPCSFSVLLLTIAFLFSIGSFRSKIIRIGGFYIFGIFTVYMLIGLGILQTLHIFDTPHFMAKLGAVLLIALGSINLINEFFPAFPIKLRIPAVAHRKMAGLMEKASVPTAFALGGLTGLCEFPCTGGPYLMALGLLHDKATYVNGLGYLLIYNLIFILPLVIILAIASDSSLLSKVSNWQKRESKPMRFWGGIAMIVLGVFIFLF